MAEPQAPKHQSKKDKNFKTVKKKTGTFFSAPQETLYDRALELNFLNRYYRELCLSIMGVCMIIFGAALTVVAIEKGISDLYILGPAPLAIGIILLIFASGFTVKRCLDRPRIGIGVDFVEAPDRDKLFLGHKATNLENEMNNSVKSDKSKTDSKTGQPKSCLRRTSMPTINPARTSIEVEAHNITYSPKAVTRKTSYTEFPASPICAMPEVAGHEGESVRSTPEQSSVALNEGLKFDGEIVTIEREDMGYYPHHDVLVNASPIDVLPGPAEYITPM